MIRYRGSGGTEQAISPAFDEWVKHLSEIRSLLEPLQKQSSADRAVKVERLLDELLSRVVKKFEKAERNVVYRDQDAALRSRLHILDGNFNAVIRVLRAKAFLEHYRGRLEAGIFRRETGFLTGELSREALQSIQDGIQGVLGWAKAGQVNERNALLVPMLDSALLDLEETNYLQAIKRLTEGEKLLDQRAKNIERISAGIKKQTEAMLVVFFPSGARLAVTSSQPNVDDAVRQGEVAHLVRHVIKVSAEHAAFKDRMAILRHWLGSRSGSAFDGQLALQDLHNKLYRYHPLFYMRGTLKPGDRLVVFVQQSLKTLNDLLGAQNNDEVIRFRQETLTQLLLNAGLIDKQEKLHLLSDYKQDEYAIRFSGDSAKVDLLSKLQAITKQLSVEVTGYLKENFSESMEKYRADHGGRAFEFTVYFGVSGEIGAVSDYEIELADLQARQGAKMARFTREENPGAGMGAEFTQSQLNQLMDQARLFATELGLLDPLAFNGKGKLREDIVEDMLAVRLLGTQEVSEKMPAKQSLKQFLNLIDLLDYPKGWVEADLDEVYLTRLTLVLGRLKQALSDPQKYPGGLDQLRETIEEAEGYLRRNLKDSRFTEASYFHGEAATKFSEGAILSADAVGFYADTVGGLIRAFQSYAQDPSPARMVQEAVRADDRVKTSMKEKVTDFMGLVENAGVRIGRAYSGQQGELRMGLREGGDELVLFAENIPDTDTVFEKLARAAFSAGFRVSISYGRPEGQLETYADLFTQFTGPYGEQFALSEKLDKALKLKVGEANAKSGVIYYNATHPEKIVRFYYIDSQSGQFVRVDLPAQLGGIEGARLAAYSALSEKNLRLIRRNLLSLRKRGTVIADTELGAYPLKELFADGPSGSKALHFHWTVVVPSGAFQVSNGGVAVLDEHGAVKDIFVEGMYPSWDAPRPDASEKFVSLQRVPVRNAYREQLVGAVQDMLERLKTTRQTEFEQGLINKPKFIFREISQGVYSFDPLSAAKALQGARLAAASQAVIKDELLVAALAEKNPQKRWELFNGMLREVGDAAYRNQVALFMLMDPDLWIRRKTGNGLGRRIEGFQNNLVLSVPIEVLLDHLKTPLQSIELFDHAPHVPTGETFSPEVAARNKRYALLWSIANLLDSKNPTVPESSDYKQALHRAIDSELLNEAAHWTPENEAEIRTILENGQAGDFSLGHSNGRTLSLLQIFRLVILRSQGKPFMEKFYWVDDSVKQIYPAEKNDAVTAALYGEDQVFGARLTGSGQRVLPGAQFGLDGYPVVLREGVYEPTTIAANQFRRWIWPSKDSQILIVGAGAGIEGLVAHKRGAKHIVMTDIGGKEVENMNENVRRARLSSNFEIAQADLLNLPELLRSKKYAHIFTNLPVLYSALKSKDGRIYDRGGALLARVLSEAGSFLEPNGTLEMSYFDGAQFLNEVYKNGWEPSLVGGYDYSRAQEPNSDLDYVYFVLRRSAINSNDPGRQKFLRDWALLSELERKSAGYKDAQVSKEEQAELEQIISRYSVGLDELEAKLIVKSAKTLQGVRSEMPNFLSAAKLGVDDQARLIVPMGARLATFQNKSRNEVIALIDQTLENISGVVDLILTVDGKTKDVSGIKGEVQMWFKMNLPTQPKQFSGQLDIEGNMLVLDATSDGARLALNSAESNRVGALADAGLNALMAYSTAPAPLGARLTTSPAASYLERVPVANAATATVLAAPGALGARLQNVLIHSTAGPVYYSGIYGARLSKEIVADVNAVARVLSDSTSHELLALARVKDGRNTLDKDFYFLFQGSSLNARIYFVNENGRERVRLVEQKTGHILGIIDISELVQKLQRGEETPQLKEINELSKVMSTRALVGAGFVLLDQPLKDFARMQRSSNRIEIILSNQVKSARTSPVADIKGHRTILYSSKALLNTQRDASYGIFAADQIAKIISKGTPLGNEYLAVIGQDEGDIFAQAGLMLEQKLILEEGQTEFHYMVSADEADPREALKKDLRGSGMKDENLVERISKKFSLTVVPALTKQGADEYSIANLAATITTARITSRVDIRKWLEVDDRVISFIYDIIPKVRSGEFEAIRAMGYLKDFDPDFRLYSELAVRIVAVKIDQMLEFIRGARLAVGAAA